LDRDAFLHQLRLSRLLESQTIDAVAARFFPTDSSSSVAKAFVDQGLLTRFQAKKLRSSKPYALRLGPYRILEQLGRGGTGPVYKAVHQTMERVAAIKVVHPRLLTDNLTLDLFRREVLAASQLHHPGLVTAYDAGKARGRHFLAMEYVDGLSLQSYVQTHGPLPVNLACELMRQAAEALQYAHEKGMVHRDIKPANLLIARSDRPKDEKANLGDLSKDLPSAPRLKVIDFGLARLRYAGSSGMETTIQVDPGAVWGTVDYISPEQAENIHTADIRSDLYSLGCSFYFGLTGQAPYPNCTAIEKLVKHLLYDAPPVSSIRHDIPAAVAALLQRLMAKERMQRFQTPAELAQELSRLLASGFGAPASLSSEDSYQPPGDTTNEPGNGWSSTQSPVQADNMLVRFLPSPASSSLRETTLQKDWRRWTALVRALAQGGVKRRPINRRSFQLLQSRLVESCNTLANLSDGPRRDFYQRLAGLVKPWVRPGILLEADKDLRSSLYVLCQQAEQELDQLATTSKGGGLTVFGGIRALFKRLRG
jgi:eukaryotic-like serine/threonine-protein kinase